MSEFHDPRAELDAAYYEDPVGLILNVAAAASQQATVDAYAIGAAQSQGLEEGLANTTAILAADALAAKYGDTWERNRDGVAEYLVNNPSFITDQDVAHPQVIAKKLEDALTVVAAGQRLADERNHWSRVQKAGGGYQDLIGGSPMGRVDAES